MRDVDWALRRSFLVAVLFIAAAAPPSILGAAEPDDNIVETFNVARHGDGLLVPVTLGDRQFQFVVDTGTTFSVIDTALEPHLDRIPGFAQINGNGRLKRYYLRTATVGKSRQLLEGKAACLDLSGLREASGYDVRGILGMTFLKMYVIRIDFDAGKLSILKALPASPGSEFRLSYNKLELPVINVDIANDDAVAWLVDTGMTHTALGLRSYRFDELVESSRLKRIGPKATVATLEGIVRFRYGQLDKFCLGDFTHERIDVVEGDQNQIGLGLLSRYVVTFDFPKDRLYLKPGKRFAEPYKFGWCGLAFGRIDGQTRIKAVGEGSAADKAGLKAGDQILRVDRKEASSLTLFEMHSILETSGRRVELDIEGPAGRRDVEIIVSGPE